MNDKELNIVVEESDEELIRETDNIDKTMKTVVGYGFKQYSKEISHLKTLSPTETTKLFEEYKNGDLSAYNKIVEGNLKFVITIALKYVACGMDIMDIIQNGNLGLMRAIEKFDVGLGFTFLTYAGFWIKKSIRDAIDESSLIRKPAWVCTLEAKVKRMASKLTNDFGRNPTFEEIANACDIEVGKVEEVMTNQFDMVSLESKLGGDDSEDEGSFASIVDSNTETPDMIVVENELKEIVEEAVSKLSERQRYIITKRYGLFGEDKMTLEELSSELGISRQAVNQCEIKTLKALKRMPKIASLNIL